MSTLALELIAKEKKEQTGTLDLGNCGLTELPDELFELIWLEELNIGSYYLDYKKLLEENSSIEKIELDIKSKNKGSTNQILHISNKIKLLTELRIFRANDNEIRNASFLTHLVKLTVLELDSHQTEKIAHLTKLINLKVLLLGDNQASDYSFLEKLINIKVLFLGENQASDYSFLEKLSNLKVLFLENNQISDIRFLEKLVNLKVLILGDNQASDYSFLEKLINIKVLFLKNNQISDIRFLEKLVNLQSLFLRGNQIADIRFLEKLTGLQSLSLSGNQIADIRFLEKLTGLQSLDLRDNKISDIKSLLPLIQEGKMLVSLEEYDWDGKINLHNNPIEIPPLEIVKQGNQAILDYYEELENQGTTELYEAKMLIIGEGGAGKTSLSRKLMDEKAVLPKEKETTKGIDIQEYYFTTSTNQEFRINIWDFGGQEIYHATHQFFLTKRSLYVLVDDTRKDDKSIHDASFNYWLQTVKLFGGDSPIVIVQNEKGDRSKVLDLKSMQASFEHIKGSYASNLLSGRNLPATKTALEFFIQQLPHIGQKLPKQWVAIRHALEDLERAGTYYISIQEYFEICSDHQIPEEERALSLSQYLHDLGVFLHFQEDDLLNRILILHNEWATDAVYKVLDAEFVKKAKGRFTKADLKKIWGDKDCKDKYRFMHSELLALMKNFELCYPLNPKENTFLAPQLFPEEQPNYEWDSKDNLILNYEYGFMPKGLLSRFMVRLNHYISNVNMAWRNGVILKKGKTSAEVLSLYAQQKIRIRVRGPENKSFLDIIMEEFDKLHATFEGIEVDKLIPCHCAVCQKAESKNKYYFKYEVLKKAYTNHVDEMRCQESLLFANVYRLINDTLVVKRIEDLRRTKSDDFRLLQKHRGGGDNVGQSKTVINNNYNYPPTEKTSKSASSSNNSPIDKKELMDLIAAADIGEVFDILLEHAGHHSLQSDIINLKKEWRKTKKAYQKKELEYDVYETKNQQVNKTLLAWVKTWT